MRSLFAIAQTTVRAAIRSHMVHTIGVLLLLTTFVLPLTIKGDGTPTGLVQISMHWILGLVGLFLSIISVWLGCMTMADDIDGHQIHLVLVKPIGRAKIWLGKLLGILCIQFLLLLISSVAILTLTLWRINHEGFDDLEMKRLRRTILVGRQAVVPQRVDLDKLVDLEYARRRKENSLPTGQTPTMMKNGLRRIIKNHLQEVRPKLMKQWTFFNVPKVLDDEPIFLRYRMYSGRVSSRDQQDYYLRWWVRAPEDGRLHMLTPSAEFKRTRIFHELPISPRVVQSDGKVQVYLHNLTAGKIIVVGRQDGPFLMVPTTGFTNNYFRVVLLMFIQIAFLAIIGCAAGASFSAPMAIFSAFSYISLGVLAAYFSGPAAGAAEDKVVPPEGVIPRIGYHANSFVDEFRTSGGTVGKIAFVIRSGTKAFTISVNEFNETARLGKGHLVELWRMALIFIKVLVLRGVPIALLGIWAFKRRELGNVIAR